MKRLIKILSRLPLGFHYGVANGILYPLAYYILRYRRGVVYKNLRNSFPDKSESEIQAIAKGFYHHLADTIAEIIYGYTISQEEMNERVQFLHLDELEQAIHTHGAAMVMLGHLANWEWMAEVGNRFTPPIQEVSVYRRLKNRSMDELMLDIRNQRGAEMVEKNQILRAVIKNRQEGRLIAYGMLSDQKPNPNSSHFWTTFLNQDTAFLDGSEVLARKFDYPVFYFYITSPKRGYYIIDVRTLSVNPVNEPEWAITSKYAQILESNILEQPSLWLWSHNRWKHKRG